MDTDGNWMQKNHICICFDQIEYKSVAGSMNINMDASRIIKLYDYRIKDMTK